MDGPHPAFTDFAFHNTGVVWDQLKPAERAALRGDDGLFRRTKDDLEAPRKTDGGRARISTLKRDLRAFKTPTLRDVTRRGPYMHDGRFETLEEVVLYYAKGGGQDLAASHHLKPFRMSKQDVADLVAFLEALTSDERPGLPHRMWNTRVERTRLRFVDDAGKALRGLRIQLTPAGDWATSVPGKAGVVRTHTTDAKGWIEFPTSAYIQTRLSLPEGLVPAGGSLVPDTCHKATVVVPVRGRVAVLVGLAETSSAPDTLAAEHQDTFVLPGHDAPRTLLQKRSSLSVGTTRIVRYEGWLRTDVPRSVLIRLPGRKAQDCRVVLDPNEPARINIP